MIIFHFEIVIVRHFQHNLLTKQKHLQQIGRDRKGYSKRLLGNVFQKEGPTMCSENNILDHEILGWQHNLITLNSREKKCRNE